MMLTDDMVQRNELAVSDGCSSEINNLRGRDNAKADFMLRSMRTQYLISEDSEDMNTGTAQSKQCQQRNPLEHGGEPSGTVLFAVLASVDT